MQGIAGLWVFEFMGCMGLAGGFWGLEGQGFTGV